jgi:capsular polysaccharide transport system permease protein
MVVGSVRTLRSGASVSAAVWKAIFLREALTRLFGARASWLWLLVEPVVHVGFMVFVYAGIRVRSIGGIDTVVWVMTGLLAFFLFRRTSVQVSNAVNANQALFVYRQVKPVDAALVRAVLEGFLLLAISFLLFAGAAILGRAVMPADPLAVLAAFAGLWLLGLGFGLITSVATEMVPELGRVIQMWMLPLYLVSGVIFPLSAVPDPYRGWLMLNPVAHGVESARLGFASYYHAVPELSLAYLFGFGLSALFVGLALYRRFSVKMVTQ